MAKSKDKSKKSKPSKEEKTPVAMPAEEALDEMKRLNRVVGQVEGIKKMLDDGRALNDILIQCKAVHSALKSVESRMLRHYLDNAVADIAKAEKKKNREQKIAELMELYKPVS